MNTNKRIGITGGIGAGKSIICRIIHTLGYPVFYSDKSAKDILNFNSDVKSKIRTVFGDEAYLNEELNRPFIAQKIFNDQKLLDAINAIVHPAVRQSFLDWAEEQTADLVFNEAAILFETGAFELYDANVLVTAPESIRIERVMKRDNITADAVRERMAKQWPDKKKEALADYIIINDQSTFLIPQVIDLIHKLKT